MRETPVTTVPGDVTPEGVGVEEEEVGESRGEVTQMGCSEPILEEGGPGAMARLWPCYRWPCVPSQGH